MTNHPTQGLQDMTLDLSTYSAEALAELQTRIEEEKTKRERKVPFVIEYYDDKSLDLTSQNSSIMLNLRHRLSAEAKLRAAGGGGFKCGLKQHYLYKDLNGGFRSLSDSLPSQGVIYFKTSKCALAASATLTPDEQAAIFGFGEG